MPGSATGGSREFFSCSIGILGCKLIVVEIFVKEGLQRIREAFSLRDLNRNIQIL